VFCHYGARQKDEVRLRLDKSSPVAAELSAPVKLGCLTHVDCSADSGSRNYAAVYDVQALMSCPNLAARVSPTLSSFIYAWASAVRVLNHFTQLTLVSKECTLILSTVLCSDPKVVVYK
jgi:hypothetical protein